MTKYVALLRGINVGGHRPLKMAELREMFTLMGYKDVATYIQSGNVIFSGSKENNHVLSNEIKQQIENTFGYDVPVLIRRASSLEQIMQRIPFEGKEGWKRYITFLQKEPTEEQVNELVAQSSDIEKFWVNDSEVYSLINKETDEKPQFSNSFMEKHFNMPTTNRNLRTLNKILELAN